MPAIRPFLPAVAAVACASFLAVPTLAAPTLEGVNLGDYASGPKVKASDLKGRVVVFEYWGQHCPPCLASIPHLAELQAKYPYQALLVVANHCQDGDAKNAAKVWADHKGGLKVAVVNQGDLTGANVSGIPRVFVFSTLGKCVFDGNPHDAKFDGAMEAAIKSSPAAAVVARLQAEQAQAKKLFGDNIPEELTKAAIQAADTGHSSKLAMEVLEKVAAHAKDPKLAERAQTMVAAFKKAVAGKLADGEAKAQTDPSQAMAAMETITVWAPQTPENTAARADIAKWRHDTAFLRELAADKAWLNLKAQADRIDFEKHPNAKPTSQLESDLKRMLKDKDFTGTKGLEKAVAAAPGWKLDAVVASADKAKSALKPTEKPEAADAAPAAPEAKAPAETPDSEKSVLGN